MKNIKFMIYGYGHLVSSMSVHCRNISVDAADQQTHPGKIQYLDILLTVHLSIIFSLFPT